MIHEFIVNSSDIADGDYMGYIKIISNGGSATIPVNLIVSDDSELLSGDVNADGILNGLDVVSLTNFILASDYPTDNQFSAGDINADGILNVLDVINLINLILE